MNFFKHRTGEGRRKGSEFETEEKRRAIAGSENELLV